MSEIDRRTVPLSYLVPYFCVILHNLTSEYILFEVMLLNRKLVKISTTAAIVIMLLLPLTIWLVKLEDDTVTAQTRNKTEYCIFIEIEDKTLFLLKDGECIKKYRVATGKKGWPSPIGSWKIIEKGDWGEGFGGHWLGLNVPWGKYGIHGTTKPGSVGRAASHGCIRMYNRDIYELYKIVPHGTPVVIVNGQFGPFGNGFREMKPGDRGADVLAVQKRLKALGYFKGYVSGIYNDDLKAAVHKFQKENGLKVKNSVTREDYNAMGFIEFE